MKFVIDECIKNNEYFLRFEELNLYFEENSISCSDRIEILKKLKEHNKKIYDREKTKAKEFLNMKNINNKTFADTQFLFQEEKKVNNVESLKCNVDEYFEKIEKTKNINEIFNLLPDRNNPEFDNILTMIMVKLYAKKVEILNFMKQYKEDVYEIFEGDLNLIEEKIEKILDYKDQKEEKIENVSSCNKVVFLKNSNGEPTIFNNLKGYEEYYDSFLELFNSILDGTLKNFGTYNNNNKINGLYKVKLFKTRIIFSRINEDTFAILGATKKKTDNDLRYRHFLENLSAINEVKKQDFIDIAEDFELLKVEDEYKEKLIYLLENKKKVKTHEANKSI